MRACLATGGCHHHQRLPGWGGGCFPDCSRLLEWTQTIGLIERSIGRDFFVGEIDFHRSEFANCICDGSCIDFSRIARAEILVGVLTACAPRSNSPTPAAGFMRLLRRPNSVRPILLAPRRARPTWLTT